MIRATGPLIPFDTNNSSSRCTFIKTNGIQASSVTTSALNATSFTSATITSDALTVNNDSTVYFVGTSRITHPVFQSISIIQPFYIYSSAMSGDGNTAAIGILNGSHTSGGIYIYVKTNGIWAQQGSQLIGSDNVGNAGEGFTVSLSYDGSTVAFGGDTDNSNAGAVWVFIRTGTSWAQQGLKLVGTGATGAAHQGYSVSLSADGSTLASGGYTDNSNNGAVWIFTRTAGVWTQQGSKLVGTGNTGAARQGYSVSLSPDGDNLASGGYRDDSDKGAVWVFTRTSAVWSQQGSKIVFTDVEPYPTFGESVSITSTGILAIGGSGAGDTGATWIFTRTDGVWSQQTKLVGTGYVDYSGQGTSVSLDVDGSTLVVGGPSDDSDVGAIWVFTRSGSSWTQLGSKITASVSSVVNALTFGYHVSINSTGTSMLITNASDTDSFGDIYDLKTSITTIIESTEAYISNLTTNEINVNNTLSVPNLNVTNLMNLRNNLSGSRPCVFAQVIPDTTATVLTTYWNSTGNVNTPSLSFSGDTPTGLYTVNQNCYVLVTVSVSFASNATGTRTLYISKNATTPYYGYTAVPADASTITFLSTSSIIQCASGDTVGVYVKQTSGAPLAMDTSSGVFSIIYLSNPF